MQLLSWRRLDGNLALPADGVDLAMRSLILLEPRHWSLLSNWLCKRAPRFMARCKRGQMSVPPGIEHRRSDAR
jgi:hypothetical protein